MVDGSGRFTYRRHPIEWATLMEKNCPSPERKKPKPRSVPLILEDLRNLIYCALDKAEHPESVRFYLKAAEDRFGMLDEALDDDTRG
jgi:hypothetical protein